VDSGTKPQPTNDLVHIVVKNAALVAAVFLVFLPIPHMAAHNEEFFSRGSRHRCHMEVGACVSLHMN